MGNCLRHENNYDRELMNWAGEDWEFLATDHHQDQNYKTKNNMKKIEKDQFSKGNDDDNVDFKSSSNISEPVTSTEVTIKVTKKQLEELLGKVDIKELSVQQVLAHLINLSDYRFDQSHHQRSWRPALQSIPEVN